MQVKCEDCGKLFEDDGKRSYKVMYSTPVPFRVAPLMRPKYLCLECEAKELEEMSSELAAKSTGTED